MTKLALHLTFVQVVETSRCWRILLLTYVNNPATRIVNRRRACPLGSRGFTTTPNSLKTKLKSDSQIFTSYPLIEMNQAVKLAVSESCNCGLRNKLYVDVPNYFLSLQINVITVVLYHSLLSNLVEMLGSTARLLPFYR